VVAASAGNLLGSLIAYLLVRRYGEALILGPGRRVGLTAGHLRLANRFFERWGLFAVFLGRLLPVIRTYISFPAGLSRITIVPFTLATIAGAIPWNLALAFAGYKLGQNYERVAGAIGPFTLPLAILVLVAIIVAYYYGRRIGETEAG
jgi:membrane protein DedA with SNARE-associated domain